MPDRDIQATVDDCGLCRQNIVAGLNRIGLAGHVPASAFYAFPSTATSRMAAQEIAARQMHDARVAVAPGNAFGFDVDIPLVRW